MSFAHVPAESKSQIKKAGKILISDSSSETNRLWALDLTNRWRACHAYPINTYQATLRQKLKSHGYIDHIVAQRLKRLPTIIEKLRREKTMKLDKMQDIGGIRAILKSVNDVERLANEYRNSEYFGPAIVNEKDYISNPRDLDGYRSVHLIFKYQNIKNPSYNGLQIELQIRSKLQHHWATAVETMGTFLGQALKARQGDRKWLDFFAVVSSAFAYKEKCPPLPRFASMSEMETYQKVAKDEHDLGALEIMKGFSIAIQAIHKERGKGTSFYLIILDTENRRVSIKPYDRDSIDLAIKQYSDIEQEVVNGRSVEPVLVSSGPLEYLKRAYPNFFLDTSEFSRNLKEIISRSNRK